MGYLDLSVAQLAVFEGVVPWMYLDTRGNVTTDMGLMLPNVGAATVLAFAVEGRPATVDEIRRDYARVKGMTAGRLPGHYVASNSPKLVEDVAAPARLARVTSMDAGLRIRMPGYAKAPDAAKLALLDMRYNLGETGLIEGYPHLCSDVANGRFDLAALGCHRKGISDARNEWTQKKLEQAAQAV